MGAMAGGMVAIDSAVDVGPVVEGMPVTDGTRLGVTVAPKMTGELVVRWVRCHHRCGWGMMSRINDETADVSHFSRVER